MRSTMQMRSQSVTQKDIKPSLRMRLSKRSSSKRKGVSGEKPPSAQVVLGNITRAIKA